MIYVREDNIMRMRKAVTALASGLLVAGLALSGCTASKSATASGPSTGGHLTKILKAKKIEIGVLASAEPYSYKSPSGGYQGFDIDIANALAKSLGAKADFIPVTDVSRIPALQADKVDVVIAAMAAKDSRAQQINLTRPYLLASTLIAVKKSSGLKSYSDLDGKKVAATQGSVGDNTLRTEFPKASPVDFTSFADSAQAVKSGKASAVISDSVTIGQLVAGDPSLEVLAGPPIDPAFVAMGIRKGDFEWLTYVNNFIMNYNISAAGQASYKKWIHQDMPTYLY